MTEQREANPDPTYLLLSHFLTVWPLALARSALRTLEALAFRRLGPIDGSVLDIGCGDGVFGRWLTPHGELWGVDTDVARLRAAAARRVHVVAADATSLPFPARAFDVAVANSTLEHVADPCAAIHEAERVLRPGGRLVFTVPLQTALDNLLFSKAIGARYQELLNDYWHHVTMQSADAWQAMVGDCAPELTFVRSLPIESRRQTEVIDLLWSVTVTEGPIIRQHGELADAQRDGLARMLAGLLAGAADRQGAEDPHSEVLLEYVKMSR